MHGRYARYARYVVTAAALMALGAESLYAQVAPPSPADSAPAQPAPATQQVRRFAPVFGITVGTMNIEPASATRSQVGDQSYGLELVVGALFKRHFYIGADIGGQFLDDNAEFTQNTTGGEMKSSAVVTYFSAATGVRTGALPVLPVALALNVGASATLSRRSIDGCSDCHVDKLDIPGGAFVEPSLVFGRRSVRLRVSNRVYFAGEGMRNVISAGADFQPRQR